MTGAELPCVLCVDDEPRTVHGLALHLRRRYRVLTAHGGQEALERMRDHGSVAVIISDMRMPDMDGATLLAKVRALHPESTRILLSGDPSRDGVIAAINSGQIFRFLSKPCSVDELNSAVEAAVEQHRLVTSERVLLQETLMGCIRTLTDVLALANPAAFGRASRLRHQVMAFSEYLGYGRGFWQLEAAAMLSQIGCLSLPPGLVDKVHHGGTLSAEEQVLVEGVGEVSSKLLRHIPRLEPVVEILTALDSRSAGRDSSGDPPDSPAAMAMRILTLVGDCDVLISQGHSAATAAQILHARAERYGAQLVKSYAAHLGTSSAEMRVIRIPLGAVRLGMTILQDIRTELGMLLVARGFEVTERFMERIKNFGPALLEETIEVALASRGPAGRPTPSGRPARLP